MLVLEHHAIFYIPVGTSKTAIDGETAAICAALKQLLCFLDKFVNVFTLSDSQATLYSLKSMEIHSSGDILKCQILIKNCNSWANLPLSSGFILTA